MKQILDYTVYARNRDELLSEVLNQYREFMDDDEATLPSNALIQMSPEVEVTAGDGTRQISLWKADVHVSTTTNS